MASFQIVENGLTDHGEYGFQPKEGENTIRIIHPNKCGLIVTITASGKPDKTFYHEVNGWHEEMTDEENYQVTFDEYRDQVLQALADEYENS